MFIKDLFFFQLCLFIVFNFIDGIETHSWRVLIHAIVLDCTRDCTMKIIVGHLDIFMFMSFETRHANTVGAKIYLFVQLYLYLTSLCKLYKKYIHEENKSTWCTHFMHNNIIILNLATFVKQNECFGVIIQIPKHV